MTDERCEQDAMEEVVVVKKATFDEFMGQVRALLEPRAGEKGYSAAGPDGPNPLYELVAEMNTGDGHALGEIVYKAKRFAAKGNPEDILKIAAWAFLVWRHRAR